MASCETMRPVSEFKTPTMSGQILSNSWKYTVVGKSASRGNIKYCAAAPPDLRLSYAGSALPFANEEMAMEGGGQTGSLDTNSFGEFQFTITCPNAYYTGQGTNLIPPCIKMIDVSGKEVVLQLGVSVPNRSLKHLTGRPDRSYHR